jgi:hypothetical protein
LDRRQTGVGESMDAAFPGSGSASGSSFSGHGKVTSCKAAQRSRNVATRGRKTTKQSLGRADHVIKHGHLARLHRVAYLSRNDSSA